MQLEKFTEEDIGYMMALLSAYERFCCGRCLLPIIRTSRVDGTSDDFEHFICDEDEIDIEMPKLWIQIARL